MSDTENKPGSRGVKFFQEHAKINNHGVATLTQKNYYDFHKAEGIDRDWIDRFHASENELQDGAYLYANELMHQNIDAASNDDEAGAANARVRITSPRETVNLTATARVTCRIPRTQEALAAGLPATTTKYGVVSIKVDRSRSVDHSIVTACTEAAESKFKTK